MTDNKQSKLNENNTCPIDHSKLSKKELNELMKKHPLHQKNITPKKIQLNCDSSNLSSRNFSKSEHVGDIFPDSNPHPNQRYKLSNDRIPSRIPKATGNVPKNATDNDNVWVFPSPQRFYNAMKKKGWDPQERDMRHVVSIHNTINHTCWDHVLQYESYHFDKCPTPKLKSFKGRPADLSLKAKLLSYLGYIKPFDRHDWIIDRCGQDIKYIIDFYEGSGSYNNHSNNNIKKSPTVYLDVRPNMTFNGIIDRIHLKYDSIFNKEKFHLGKHHPNNDTNK